MHKTKTTLSIRVTHPKIKWEEVAEKITLKPEFKWSVGDATNTPSGGFRKETYCTFRLQENECYVDDAIRSSLEDISMHRDYFKEIIKSGGEVEFFIGVFIKSNTGFEIDEDLMKHLLDMNISLSFDIYSDGE